LITMPGIRIQTWWYSPSRVSVMRSRSMERTVGERAGRRIASGERRRGLHGFGSEDASTARHRTTRQAPGRSPTRPGEHQARPAFCPTEPCQRLLGDREPHQAHRHPQSRHREHVLHNL
jgi:hypothetical protein